MGDALVGSRCSIVLGPVIGKVTETSARILIETDADAAVTCRLTPCASSSVSSSPPSSASPSSASPSASSSASPSASASASSSSASSSPADEKKQDVVKTVQFVRGVPKAFVFENLQANTHYTVSFESVTNAHERQGSFRSFDSAASQIRVVVAACDKGPSKRGKVNLFTKLYEEYVSQGLVDVVVRHGDQVYADSAFKIGKKIFQEEKEEKERDRKIVEEYQKVYRKMWNAPDVAKIFANVSHLMLWDDHEIRNDFGTLPQDRDRSSMDYQIAKCARKAYWLYQRQLWDDVEDVDSPDREHDDECSMHRFGWFGVMMVDGRGSRSFAVSGEKKPGDDAHPFFSGSQWNKVSQALSPGGLYDETKCLVVCHSMPPLFMSTWASQCMGKIPAQVDKMGLGLSPDEQCEYIELMHQWKARTQGEILLVGGDLHFGVQTDVMDKDGKQVLFKSLISSAISNSPPPLPVYYMLRSFLADRHNGLGKGGVNRYTFRHHRFVNERNFGYVVMSTSTSSSSSSASASSSVASSSSSSPSIKYEEEKKHMAEEMEKKEAEENVIQTKEEERKEEKQNQPDQSQNDPHHHQKHEKVAAVEEVEAEAENPPTKSTAQIQAFLITASTKIVDVGVGRGVDR